MIMSFIDDALVEREQLLQLEGCAQVFFTNHHLGDAQVAGETQQR